MSLIGLGSHVSEFEIQAFLLYQLRKLGYQVRGEIRLARGSKAGRVDLAVFSSKGTLIRIVEVKRFRGSDLQYSQVTKYLKYGPVDIVKSMGGARSYVDTWLNGPPQPHFEIKYTKIVQSIAWKLNSKPPEGWENRRQAFRKRLIEYNHLKAAKEFADQDPNVPVVKIIPRLVCNGKPA